MIENDSEDLRLVICPDNKRTANVLHPIIQEHVEAGSEIHTDFWAAYGDPIKRTGLSELGYLHRRVNHSDPENRFVGN
jgi:hypothetical protein